MDTAHTHTHTHTKSHFKTLFAIGRISLFNFYCNPVKWIHNGNGALFTLLRCDSFIKLSFHIERVEKKKYIRMLKANRFTTRDRFDSKKKIVLTDPTVSLCGETMSSFLPQPPKNVCGIRYMIRNSVICEKCPILSMPLRTSASFVGSHSRMNISFNKIDEKKYNEHRDSETDAPDSYA